MHLTQFIDTLRNNSVGYAQQHLLIRRQPPLCTVIDCNRQMSLISDKSETDLKKWRCPTHKARKKSVRVDSWFSGSKISLENHLLLIYLWAHQIPVTTAITLTRLGSEAVVQWYAYTRDVCTWYLEQPQNRLLFGVDQGVVEIDESLMRTPKHHRGHPGAPRWIFGLYDRNTRQGHLEFVENRSQATLFPIIQQYVAPGATIISDGWQAYQAIPQINQIAPYVHRVVIHEDTFVDPLDPNIHTNNIEAFWKSAKSAFKRMNGTSSEMIPSHLDEFLFRDRLKKQLNQGGPCHWEVFLKILESIAMWYPTP